ncbi:hypothetical protein [Variovorax sp. PAMC 28711]|uniref:hypothetical protein n=1 Tax=Variovorax sp. PAMC 28711 TaxID=1795631 RepID=UPI0012E8F512|nr:hypothetical protein [Variovorax sp. PAMC 28711]
MKFNYFLIPQARNSLWVAFAAASIALTGCNDANQTVASTSTATTATTPVTPAPAAKAPSVNDCGQAMKQLRQCHQKVVADGRASALQREQSATYLRRLEAWWQMDGNNPAIQASCSAIANDKESCAPAGDSSDPEDAGMTEAQFKLVMKQFDAAGVPP